MSKHVGTDWDKYKEEMMSMHKDGLSSRLIMESLEDKYGIFESINTSRIIRRLVAKWSKEGGSIVDETLHRGNLKDNSWKVAWVKDSDTGVSALVRNPDYQDEVVDYDVIKEDMIEEMKAFSPKVKKYKRKKTKDPHCLVLDIADLHIGKLATESGTGDTYNVDVAVKRAMDGCHSLMDKSNAYNLDKVYFVIGNDILHIDNPKRGTTAGTPQDTDGMWYDNFKIARIVYCNIINELTQISDVHVIHCPSNHDYMSGFMLADAVQCYFHNNKNVTFDVSNMHRKYVKYGNNMLGFSHGDGAKIDKVPYLAAHEAKEIWAETTYRYAYLHHLHHKQYYKFLSGADYIGMTVEYLRSPSGTDRWHADNGFTGSKVAIEAFIHHPEYGQVSRLSHNF